MNRSIKPIKGQNSALSSRKTQAERSSSTRSRVCQATLEALAEVGHGLISTAMIAQKAKVSRGALTHQFPSRNDLLVAALRQLHEDWEVADPFGADPNETQYTLPELTEALWLTIFSDTRYIAAIELMLAARLDNELGQRLRDEMKRWVDIRDVRISLLVGFEPDNETHTLKLHLILSVLRGIAVHQSFDPEIATGRKLVDLWKQILKGIMEEPN
ncbi:TetR/AcrR family transcriptional regulator [Brucella pseudogrignonensis]|uniref:AcrR family transcriptional regulator n=1 Tax=Brucella pseudogrignonensis TaxID=419475 RepID=A0ABU1MEU6_9HYPH|nr:TetR/AcrR family transcriptional regulator [Brucella pseudogrignonensis]MDR6434565.1 AcrR family transcriptional regulator [Brucella pseudogrignonensis]